MKQGENSRLDSTERVPLAKLLTKKPSTKVATAFKPRADRAPQLARHMSDPQNISSGITKANLSDIVEKVKVVLVPGPPKSFIRDAAKNRLRSQNHSICGNPVTK